MRVLIIVMVAACDAITTTMIYAAESLLETIVMSIITGWHYKTSSVQQKTQDYGMCRLTTTIAFVVVSSIESARCLIQEVTVSLIDMAGAAIKSATLQILTSIGTFAKEALIEGLKAKGCHASPSYFKSFDSSTMIRIILLICALGMPLTSDIVVKFLLTLILSAIE